VFKLVSIIIPTLNEEKSIGKCLEALSLVDKLSLRTEVIVVDNGSVDATVRIASKLADQTLIKTGVNISALRNYGVANSEGDLLAFVDADCILDKDWLKQAINCMIHQSVDAVGSYYAIPEDASWIGKAIELMQMKKIGANVKYIPAGNILVKRSCFLAIDGFDETLITNEDVDFCHRLRNYGYKLYCDPSIKSVHLGTPKKIKEIITKQIWHGTNNITIFIRDMKKVRNVRIVIYSVINLLFLSAMTLGIFLFLLGKPTLFAISLCLYLIFHTAITFEEWRGVRKGFLHLFFYIIIYGFARSISTLKWIMRRPPRKG